MAGLALLLKGRGHEVSGCDLHATPRTKWLERQGIAVFVGHDPAHLKNVDEVIVTPAVDEGNPELRTWRNAGGAHGSPGARPLRYRGEVLAQLVSADESIAVCGSHGKTTTATWIARLLLALGENVAWCIGGETGDFPVAGVASPSAAKGEGCPPPPVLVVEADESDGTLALYHAKTLVVNKCEYDHPDHFKTEADYFACYETAKRNAAEVIESERLGELAAPDGQADVQAILAIRHVLDSLAPHNRKNARAAVEVALRRGHAPDAIARWLPGIVATLPDRRFQRIWPPNGRDSDFRVFTDYAHHPTEMKCAVEMARAICVGTLRVLFQPHRYSRTRALLHDFPSAFVAADEVILCPTYAAFEQPVPGGDVADLHRVCRTSFDTRQGCRPKLSLAESCNAAWRSAFAAMRPGDLTLLLGAGDIFALVPQVQKDCGGADGDAT